VTLTHESCDQDSQECLALHHSRAWLEVLRVVVRDTDLISLRMGKLPLDTLMGKFIAKEIS
jgi:hypothetical protein